MSIINDALKKTQDKLVTKEKIVKKAESFTTEAPIQTQAAISPTTETNYTGKKNWLKSTPAILLYFAIFNCVLFLSIQKFTKNPNTNVFNFIQQPQGSSTAQSNQKGNAPAILQAQETISQSVNIPLTNQSSEIVITTASSTLTLKGTMMTEDKRAAIIDNDIYEVGEVIDGKEITSISLNTVELLDETGETITLKVNSK